MSFDYLTVSVQDRIATVTISREKALNALNVDLIRELKEVFLGFKKNLNEVSGVIITGAGEKAFVAGADIAAMKDMSSLDAKVMCDLGHETFSLIENSPMPVIAAVNGFALGGGLELALACDFIYASKNAQLGLPEVGLGLFPGFGGTQRLPRWVGRQRALELILTGARIDVEQAHQLGLVNRICEPDELLPTCMKTLQKIQKQSQVAVAMAKKMVRGGSDLPMEAGLGLERAQFPMMFATEDCQEGIGAFLEKRKPEFKGR